MKIKECSCDACKEFDATEERWREWLRALEEDVVQEEYGYEPGEFTVFPSLWREAFDQGLTPTEAWERSLSQREVREVRLFGGP